jgi:hypothetical protein
MIKITLLAFLALSMAACTTRLGAFTLASTKNLGAQYQPLQTHVVGEDCARLLLFIPLGSLNPNVQEAVDRAVEQVPGGDMMTNVTVHEDFLITVLYNSRCVKVVGDVVSTRNPATGISQSVSKGAPVRVAQGQTTTRVAPRNTTGSANLGAARRSADSGGWVEVGGAPNE